MCGGARGVRGAWAGRRKGVVEFVDRTHFYAVNQNDAFLQTCATLPLTLIWSLSVHERPSDEFVTNADTNDRICRVRVRRCAKNEHAYHTPTGELTKWMDNAFASKMKVPFYGKHPHEMNR